MQTAKKNNVSPMTKINAASPEVLAAEERRKEEHQRWEKAEQSWTITNREVRHRVRNVREELENDCDNIEGTLFDLPCGNVARYDIYGPGAGSCDPRPRLSSDGGVRRVRRRRGGRPTVGPKTSATHQRVWPGRESRFGQHGVASRRQLVQTISARLVIPRRSGRRFVGARRFYRAHDSAGRIQRFLRDPCGRGEF